MQRARFAFALIIALGASIAAAQQLYRWTDEKGRVHVTDTPPPPGAKDVRRIKPGATAREPTSAVPVELARLLKEFPVTLYSAPSCADPCASARAALNERGVPFKEVQVWEERSAEELKRISGNTQVPTLTVGTSFYEGFQRAAYDALLDSAGYPRTGLLPRRSQAAPAAPEGYAPPSEPDLKAEPLKPAPAETPSGPYAPGARPQRPK